MTTYRSDGNIDFRNRPDSLIAHVDQETDESTLTDVDEGEDHKICDCIDQTRPGIIPYKSIYEYQKDGAESHELVYFKPGLSVHCLIVSAQVESNVFVFQIKLEHDGQTWIIDRKRTDFEQLHNKLVLFMATQQPGFGFARFRKKRTAKRRGSEAPSIETTTPRRHLSDSAADVQQWDSSGRQEPANYRTTASVGFDEDEDDNGQRRTQVETTQQGQGRQGPPRRRRAHKMPDFPPKDKKGNQDVSITRDQLQMYFNRLLHIKALRNHKETAAFLEVSHLSFMDNLGKKFKEGKAHKRPGGRLDYNSIGRLLHERFTSWFARWFIVKESYLAYLHPGTDVVREVMLFDNAWDTEVHPAPDANSDHGLSVKNFSRILLVQFKTEKEAETGKRPSIELLLAKERSGGTCILLDQLIQQDQEATPSGNQTLFIDGSSYFEHAANMMEMAKEEIFIGGWFVSPEIFMKRPPQRHGDRWNLSTILKRKAKEGIHVFILLYQEYTQIVDNGSAYAQRKFSELHPNIIVARHPSQSPLPTPWAHHEKILIIDQSIAFVGGIDLSFGRWDTHEHRLTDLDSMDDPALARTTRSTDHVADMQKLERYKKFLHGEERQKIAPLLNTPPKKSAGKVKEMFEHLRLKRDESHVLMDQYNKMMADIGSLEDACLDTAKGAYWIGKDYINWYVADIRGLELPFCDNTLIDRTKIVRTPWHDCHCVAYGAVARDVARHFIQRWNQNKEEQLNDDTKYPFLVPKSYDNLHVPQVFQRNSHKCNVQVVRSVTNWSSGRSAKDDSVQQAYSRMIESAKHYVYIENQFFITMLNDPYVSNLICKALYDRIIRAHRANEKFRVYVLMPLLPAFVGELGSSTVEGTLLSNLLYFTYGSISKGRQSLLENLRQEIGDDYSKYITFYSLRKHGRLGGKLVDSILYIHTKAIVVDDNKTLIASANINDRSMIGDRDSEVGFYIEDEEFVQSKMNGSSYSAGKFAKSFRRHLMAEHLGLIDAAGRIIESNLIDLNDPVSDAFWNKFRQISAKNTDIFDRVFKCYPTDNVTTWEDLERYKLAYRQGSLAIADPREAELHLNGLKGHLIDFPIKFLQNADLAPPVLPESIQFPFT